MRKITFIIYSAIKLLYNKKLIGVYNIGSGKPTPLIKVVKYLANLLNKKFVIKKISKQTMLVADIKKLLKLGWKPKKSIVKILKTYHSNFNKK